MILESILQHMLHTGIFEGGGINLHAAQATMCTKRETAFMIGDVSVQFSNLRCVFTDKSF